MTEPLGFPLATVAVFAAMAIGGVVLDLFAHRSDKPVDMKDALKWTAFWLASAVVFGLFVRWRHGREIANLFFTGYALEEVLSVDNLFVMMAIFAWFKVPNQYRHRVLYWGVIGAVFFRMAFVAVGAGLFALGPYVELVFAAVVAGTAVLMLKNRNEGEGIEDYSNHVAYRLVHRFFPVWPRLAGRKFFLGPKELAAEQAAHPDVILESRDKGKRFESHELTLKELSERPKEPKLVATPLFLCLAVIELSDVMFAFDSVPAVIAVSREPLIVYSAMMFAILGLRTLYFALEAAKRFMAHLEKAVVVLLFFVALKLALSASERLFGFGYELSANASLWIVLGVLAAGAGASLLFPPKGASCQGAEPPPSETTWPPAAGGATGGLGREVDSTQVRGDKLRPNANQGPRGSH